MKLMRILLPIAVVTFGFVVTTSNVTATPDLAKKEKTACKTCHVEANNFTIEASLSQRWPVSICSQTK